MLPNFLIVGAAKSGTTSLYRYLKEHPQIFMPDLKEPHFFLSEVISSQYQIVHQEEYERLFSKVKGEISLGEGSNGYLWDKGAPQKIKNILGNIKIIIILRDPVNMSYSLYNHMLYKGGETILSFEEALEAEKSRFNNPEFINSCLYYHANYYYFNRALYFSQVKRYIDTFGKENVCIQISEDFFRNPLRVIKEVYKFLGVNPNFVPEIRIYNKGVNQLFNFPLFWRDKIVFKKTISFLFSRYGINRVKKFIQYINRPPRPLSKSTKEYLRRKFYNDICNLEILIGKDLSDWKR